MEGFWDKNQNKIIFINNITNNIKYISAISDPISTKIQIIIITKETTTTTTKTKATNQQQKTTTHETTKTTTKLKHRQQQQQYITYHGPNFHQTVKLGFLDQQ